MESSVFLGIISAVLIAVVNIFAYQLGKKNIEKERSDEISEALRRANKARNSLRNNPDIVNELHDQFKR